MSLTGDPVPPRNVRVELLDGSVVPCECVYAGADAEGLQRWVVVNVRIDPTRIRRVCVDLFPPRSTLLFEGPAS